jgi:hypothetical protein
MVQIGDYTQCPQCTRQGRVVWISQNKQVVGIQCAASHSTESIPNAYGFSHKAAKANKNSVFLVEAQTITEHAEVKC